MSARPFKPTAEQLVAARDRVVQDIVGRDLRVLFVGINPGLYSAAIGHHFGRPGNRFWPALHAAGFTPRLLDPREERELVPLGYGITNVVRRASAAADHLTASELTTGGKRLKAKVKRFAPRFLAVLGVQAYRIAFAKPKAQVGLQEETIGATKV